MPVAEKLLIAQIRRLATGRGPSKNRARTARGSPAIIAGIGDDCAVLRLPPGRESLVTTDFSLEGIHFRRDWEPPESVGQRCLARGLSDIAAMGGDPVAAFLSLALPRNLPQAWVGKFLRGLIGLAGRIGVTLAGGDTAESPNGILADIVVVGTVPRGKAILRSGARPGDRIYVSGELGGSAAALQQMKSRQMKKKPKRELNPAEYPRHFFPEPRIELGRILREQGLASAMIDTSDGLSTDLSHICEESGVGAEVEAEAIPRARVGKPLHQVDLELALHGGEDYELLFTVGPRVRVPARFQSIPLTRIGVMRRGHPGTVYLCGKPLGALGFDHFRGSR